MIRWIYNLLFPVAFLLTLPVYLRRMFRRGNYRRAFSERFGFHEQAASDGAPRPWLQAVSVGEMLAALKLARALQARAPGIRLILSTTTTTGYQLALDRAGPDIQVIYTPIDSPGCVRRAFAALRPSHLVIVDGGLWPNMLWEARRRGIGTSLVNARLSPRSEARWRRFPWLARPIMELLDQVAVPDPADIARWRKLGVPGERIHCTGSIKFDDDASPAAKPLQGAATVIPPGAPILLAGSTHPGEERAVAEAFLRLRTRFPTLFLVVAPRHVERSAAVFAELTALGIPVALRTAPAQTLAPSALLLNTTGELRDWYSVATIVFIGKSLLGQGGQNPMEAVAAGKPVLFGPRMDNFRDLAAQLVQSGAAIQVADAPALEAACAALLADPAACARQAAAGLGLLGVHRGAALRTADLLLATPGFCPRILPLPAPASLPIVQSPSRALSSSG